MTATTDGGAANPSGEPADGEPHFGGFVYSPETDTVALAGASSSGDVAVVDSAEAAAQLGLEIEAAPVYDDAAFAVNADSADGGAGDETMLAVQADATAETSTGGEFAEMSADQAAESIGAPTDESEPGLGLASASEEEVLGEADLGSGFAHESVFADESYGDLNASEGGMSLAVANLRHSTKTALDQKAYEDALEAQRLEEEQKAARRAHIVEVHNDALTRIGAVPDTDKEGFLAVDKDGNLITPSVEGQKAIDDAVKAYLYSGISVSFLVYDFEHGFMLYRGLDDTYYCASTIKAPFAAYLCEDKLDTGLVDPESTMSEGEVFTGTGDMWSDGETEYSVRTVIEKTVALSDNTGYHMLWKEFGGSDFEAWTSRFAPSTTSWGGAEYPGLSTRCLAKLWVGIDDYLLGDGDNANFCGSILASTSHSFIRMTLGADVSVWSKPGYDTNFSYWTIHDMGALHDAGIVDGNSGRYLIVVMSNADYDDDFQTEHEGLITTLVSALNAEHDEIAAVIDKA